MLNQQKKCFSEKRSHRIDKDEDIANKAFVIIQLV